jgi:P21-Rho-binding domain/WH1 domain
MHPASFPIYPVQLMKTAFATLFFEDNSQWKQSPTAGAVGLIIDRGINARVLRIFDLQQHDLLFETPLFAGMQYNATNARFHVIEKVPDGQIALQFMSIETGTEFAQKVMSMIPQPDDDTPTGKKKAGFFSRLFGKKERKEADISTPTNFIHKSHIGFDISNGFDVSNIPDEWKAMFKEAGIKKKHLRDKDTAAIIYTAACEEMKNLIPAAPPIPAPTAPAAPPVPDAPPVPAAPVVNRAARSATVMPDSSNSTSSGRSRTQSDAKKVNNASVDSVGNLMSQIRLGVKLKPVVQHEQNMELTRLDSTKRMSMLSTLRTVMNARRIAMQSIESDDESEDSDWE